MNTSELTAVDEHVEESRVLPIMFGVELRAVEHPGNLLLRVHVALPQTTLVRFPDSKSNVDGLRDEWDNMVTTIIHKQQMHGRHS